MNKFKRLTKNNLDIKKFFLIPFAFLILFSGCTKKNDSNDQSAYQKINNMLVNLKSYKCNATVKYISNKNTNTYETIQHCKSDGSYRVEITAPENSAGNITLSDGKTIYQYNSKINGRVSVGYKESMERSELFLSSFIKNYSKSLETSVSVANMDKSKCTVLEAQIPGEHPYLSSEKLFIDNETQKPVELIIYDKDNSERIVVTFTNFEYNIELEDSLFKI